MINFDTALTGPPAGGPMGTPGVPIGADSPAGEPDAPIEEFAAALGQLLAALGMLTPPAAPVEPNVGGGQASAPFAAAAPSSPASPTVGRAAPAATLAPAVNAPPAFGEGQGMRLDPSLWEAAMPETTPGQLASATAIAADASTPPSATSALRSTAAAPTEAASITLPTGEALAAPPVEAPMTDGRVAEPVALARPAPDTPVALDAPAPAQGEDGIELRASTTDAAAEPETTLVPRSDGRAEMPAVERPRLESLTTGVASAEAAAEPQVPGASTGASGNDAPAGDETPSGFGAGGAAPIDRAGDAPTSVAAGPAPTIVAAAAPTAERTAAVSRSELQAAPSAPARAIAEQAVPQIVERLDVMVRDGVQEARVRLSPPELGEVRIHLTMTDGALDVSMAAERPATREALAASLPDLRQALESRNLAPQRLDVNTSGSGMPWAGRGGDRGDDAQQQNGPAFAYGEAEPETPATRQAARAWGRAEPGRIDYRA